MHVHARYLAALLISLLPIVLSAQTSDETSEQDGADTATENLSDIPADSPIFGMGLDIGFNTLPTELADGSLGTVGWQHVAFRPDLAIGSFGIGLNLDFNFRFDGGEDGQSFEIRPEDWVVGAGDNFLEVYLPKFRYIRYGQKGEPLYVLLGNVENGVLGNGFIVGGYNNTLYSPAQRIFGLNFDLDGALFEFPYVGIETMVANLAYWDLLAARLYVRPLAILDIPVIKEMQFGVSIAADSNPHYFDPDADQKANPDQDSVLIWGIDLRQPIVAGDVFTLSLFGDVAGQNGHIGIQGGFGGKIVGLINYLALVRYLDDNFLPVYFDASYDVLRTQKYSIYSGEVASPSFAGYLFSLGFSVLEDALGFNTTLDGPFEPDADVSFKNPNLKAVLYLREGLVGGLSLTASYQKLDIKDIEDLISPVNAVVGAAIGYKVGPAVITLVYNLRYDPYSERVNSDGEPELWEVSSRLETSIELF